MRQLQPNPSPPGVLDRAPIPRVVDWQITSRCTRTCAFCYGPKSTSDMATGDALRTIGNLASSGVRVVGVTGGEPLVRDDIDTLLSSLRDRGLRVCLFTNCDFYKARRNTILQFTDTLGLPLEGPSSDVHDRVRGANSFTAVLQALKDSFQHSTIKYRIGTVLTTQTVRDVLGISRLLAPFSDRILCWKLYELVNYADTPQLFALRARDVTPAELIGAATEYMPKDKVLFDTCSSRSRSYFLIKPDGAVFVPVLETTHFEERVLGNVLGDLSAVKMEWARHIDVESYEHRCQQQYSEYPDLATGVVQQ